MLLMFLWACDTLFGADPPPPEGPTVPTLLGEASGVAFEGNWTSPSCGGRSYARNLRFEVDGTYAAIDLVSPCPPGTHCVWSGMVGYNGSWSLSDPKHLAMREMGAPAGPGSPHPTVFTADINGNLIESGCSYQKGLTVPPGYSEEQVTPRVPQVPITGTAPSTP